jgi:hypothetical protein
MPRKYNQQLEPHSRLGAAAKTPGQDQQPAPSAALLKRSLPRASVQKAARIFENFGLSKFPKESLPSNYVHPYKRDASLSHAELTRHVHDFQKKKIEQHLHKLKTAEQQQQKADGKLAVRGITVALPKDRIGKLLPSYNREKGTVTLDDLMGLVAGHTTGTEFLAKGDPTLNRLAFLKRVEKLRKNLGLDARAQKKREAQ